MGAPTIEARLRIRLLAVIAPALVGVGVAAVAVTAYVLDASDRAAATERGLNALSALAVERQEGDLLEAAAAEVLAAAESDGVRLVLRADADPSWRGSARRMPRALLGLEPGACAVADGEGGDLWRACAVSKGPAEAIAAISIRSHRAMVWTLARVMLAVVLAALLGVVWAVRRAVQEPMKAVNRLVDWSERVADEDALPAPKADTEEVERLVASFDRLVRRLFETLARERANSAHMAHELRTPLTTILAELDALDPSPAVERVRDDVKRLARVVDAVLILSAPRMQRPMDGVVNLADLARELAPEDTLVEAPDEALIDGDARLVSLALHNLFENARKHGGREARKVRVSRDGGVARLAVIDDGPGLDAPARVKMFDRHWRATAESGGTGLGLALVRAVAEHHGGRAEALPNDTGDGLEVGMTLGPVVGWHDAPHEDDPLGKR